MSNISVKQMGISRDKKRRLNNKTLKQMGIRIDKKNIEQEDSETDGNKYRQEEKIE